MYAERTRLDSRGAAAHRCAQWPAIARSPRRAACEASATSTSSCGHELSGTLATARLMAASPPLVASAAPSSGSSAATASATSCAAEKGGAFGSGGPAGPPSHRSCVSTRQRLRGSGWHSSRSFLSAAASSPTMCACSCSSSSCSGGPVRLVPPSLDSSSSRFLASAASGAHVPSRAPASLRRPQRSMQRASCIESCRRHAASGSSAAARALSTPSSSAVVAAAVSPLYSSSGRRIR